MIDDRPMSSGVVPGLDTTRSDDFDVPIWTSPKAIVELGAGVDAKTGAMPVQESG
jgi:hypothetical protein